MILYGLKNCDTCRKARRMLEGAGHTVTLRDLREAPLSAQELDRFLETFGAELVNRRSTTWRGLASDQRDAPPPDLIAAHPALMKRPVIEAESRLLPGWNKEVLAALC
ncbi:Spx/MgsR family transcriptional regulator [Rhodovulum bhavnagarense]|uniref:Spx/MgsR family transcriptional regulator n=1 Tax=Rhodovulum bhavnagarense TaxID=992286 RepID=A0A4R2RGT3_9RHOB|nr:ArsC/Spx/MgsR family protein [Rhodovulum bhavnagarense]TCP62890.1 Spx/MgsR family transcriptional regulator [Rhodovulum bhavnagarense]